MRDIKIDGGASRIECRIEVKDNSNIIVRVESEKNVIVTAILFDGNEFLENIKNYYEGDIYVNSDEEKKFLWLMNKNYLIFLKMKVQKKLKVLILEIEKNLEDVKEDWKLFF